MTFKRKYKSFIYFGAVLVLLIFFALVGFVRPVENLLAYVIRPVMSLAYNGGAKFSRIYGEQTDRRDLNQVVADLENRLSAANSENLRLKLLEEENKTLREHLNFLVTKQKKYVMANVIYGGDPNLVNQQLVIDQGTKNGIIPGLAIVDSNGNVVGKILSANSLTANICLINNSSCQFASTIMNKGKTIGVTKGELGLTIKMDFIPQTEQIKKDDIVFTSGLENNIPRGLVIGRLSEIKKENNALWQTASIESFSNFNELSVVAVIIP
ncbi:MAG: rod shape-determining protein MreC [bacterium]